MTAVIGDHVHAHPPGYVETRPGVCRWTATNFGVELSCDRADIPGHALCVRHFIAQQLGVTEAEAAALLDDYARRMREGMQP